MVTTWVVPGTVIVACFIAAAMMWTIGNKHWPWAIILLTLTGSAGLMTTPIGAWMRSRMADVSGRLASVAGRYGLPVGLWAIALGIGLYVVLHIKHRNQGGIRKIIIDEKILMAVAVLPLVSGSIPGAFGRTVSSIIGFAVTGVTFLVSYLF